MKTHHGRKNVAGGYLVEATPRQGHRREQEIHPTYQARKYKARYRMGMGHGEIHRQCHHRNNRCRCISMVWQPQPQVGAAAQKAAIRRHCNACLGQHHREHQGHVLAHQQVGTKNGGAQK